MSTHHETHAHHHARVAVTPVEGGAATDPVCGMTVAPTRTPYRHERCGVTFFFCSGRCLDKFRAAPDAFGAAGASASHAVAKPRRAPPEGAPAVEYTCPMHPEIVQIGPGTCPKCGMALEPRVAAAETHEDHELGDMRRRLVERVSAVFVPAVVVVAAVA